MAKRLTDTNKYKKPFVRGLLGPYKLLWDYLYHDCDHAGIWIIDFEIAQVYLGPDMKVNKEDALRYFNEGEIRILEIDQNRWFIVPFIEFQYGVLNDQNRAHNSVIEILKKHNLFNGATKGLASPLLGCKDKDKDKDKDKEKNKEECEGKKEKQTTPTPENLHPSEGENLYPRILELFPADLHPKNEKQKKDWIGTLEKLISIDGHPPEEILKVVDSTRRDEFWQKNFLSVLKLRKKNKEEIFYYTVFKNRLNGNLTTKNGSNQNAIEGRFKRVNQYWDR